MLLTFLFEFFTSVNLHFLKQYLQNLNFFSPSKPTYFKPKTIQNVEDQGSLCTFWDLKTGDVDPYSEILGIQIPNTGRTGSTQLKNREKMLD